MKKKKILEFYSVKLGKKNFKKLNFINLFGYEEKKIMFLDFTSVKLKKSENKFLEIYLYIMENGKKNRHIKFF